MNVEVVHVGVIHFKIRHSLIDIRYLKSGILPRFMYSIAVSFGILRRIPSVKLRIDNIVAWQMIR
jgi:hypothetical protein